MAQLIACVSNVEVQSVIWYLYVWNLTWLPSNIYREICEVYGDCIVSVQTVRKWIRPFKVGRINVTDEDREGKPSDARNTDTIAGVRALLEDNCRFTVRQLNLLMQYCFYSGGRFCPSNTDVTDNSNYSHTFYRCAYYGICIIGTVISDLYFSWRNKNNPYANEEKRNESWKARSEVNYIDDVAL